MAKNEQPRIGRVLLKGIEIHAKNHQPHEDCDSRRAEQTRFGSESKG